jgi:hypothetical protein
MKKVIAAAAGLMLVGVMAGTASADVSLGGDARARFLYQSNYDLGQTVTDPETGAVSRKNEAENKVTSRFRLQARGVAAGGAYAVGRIRMGDGTWDGGKSGTADSYIDKAYIGVPMGSTELIAGRIYYDLLKSTYFYDQDNSADGAEFKIMASDMATVGFYYLIDYEAAKNGDLVDDNDISRYAIYADLKFAGDWAARAGLFYKDNQVTDTDIDDGAYGGFEFMGPGGPLAIKGAFAFDDTVGEDTGYGGFIQAGMGFGATNVALNVGWTQDGLVTDGDFGFIMLGGGQSISPSSTIVGKLGDTWWIGAPISFAVSEMLTLTGNLVYADFDTAGDGFEISGSATYKISDGAAVRADIGYLAYSAGDDTALEEDPFGVGVTFQVKF